MYKRQVPPHCFISNNTRLSIVLDAKMKTSEKDIAFRHSVSHATVNSLLQQLYQDFKVQRNFLPPHLCFDEFRSVKGVDASMSFLFLNAESGQILNIPVSYTHLRHGIQSIGHALQNLRLTRLNRFEIIGDQIKDMRKLR